MRNILILILILIFVGILFLFDLPTYNKVAFLKSEIKKHSRVLEEKEGLIDKISQLEDVYETYKDEVNKVHYVLPSEKDISGLIVQFEALASENGLILEKLNFFKQAVTKEGKVEWGGGQEITPVAQSGSQKGFESLDIFLSLTGNYQSLKSFLEALESNVRLMDIKSIKFFSEEKSGSIFTFDIELKAYYQ